MKILLPQEVQARYVIPSLRREFAKGFVEEGLTQKEAADLLGVTEAAVSNYFSSKRAGEVKFSDEVKEMVEDACRRIIKEESSVMEEMYELSNSQQVRKSMCKVHMKHDKNVGPGCRLCMGGGVNG